MAALVSQATVLNDSLEYLRSSPFCFISSFTSEIGLY